MASLPDWVQGARRRSMLVTFLLENTTIPEDLTNATITGFIGSSSGIGVATAITGPLTVVDGAAGQFRWDFSAADVANAGTFKVQFSAAYGSDPTPAKTFQASWYIERSLAVAAP